MFKSIFLKQTLFYGLIFSPSGQKKRHRRKKIKKVRLIVNLSIQVLKKICNFLFVFKNDFKFMGASPNFLASPSMKAFVWSDNSKEVLID